MVVKCPRCGNKEVVLETQIKVKFQFNEHGELILMSNVMDDIYWGIAGGDYSACAKSLICGYYFEYVGI